MSFLEQQVIRYKIIVSNHETMFMSYNPVFGTLLIPDQQLCKCMDDTIYFLGWFSNFVGSESGQKQSVKLLQDMVYDTTQHPRPPPLPPPFVHGGNSSQAGSKIPTNSECISSL
jgi:hypothetical protein